jgi:hypothetical protein
MMRAACLAGRYAVTSVAPNIVPLVYLTSAAGQK